MDTEISDDVPYNDYFEYSAADIQYGMVSFSCVSFIFLSYGAIIAAAGLVAAGDEDRVDRV